ncbi:MAG: TSUP family transporter [Lachnospiraceae bacterium]
MLTPKTFLIVCPLVFLAGLVDSIAGGGGLISLPAYLIAGLPVHGAIATNKMSSSCGTFTTTVRFLKHGLVNIRIAIPTVIAAIVGSSLGARLSLHLPEDILRRILLFVLPVVAFFVLNPKLFKDREESKTQVTGKTIAIAVLAAFLIGMYDGLYGPGTGTFLIIAFTVFAKLSIRTANAQAKCINLASNITALVLFLLSGSVIVPLGLAAAACNVAGNLIGSGIVMDKGAQVVRPIILVVLVLLLLRALGVY